MYCQEATNQLLNSNYKIYKESVYRNTEVSKKIQIC